MSEQKIKPAGSRSEVVQVMRFMAASMVLYAHNTFYFKERVDPSFEVSQLGPEGVALFFMISGLVMVVSSQKLSRDYPGAKEFMIHRLLRIVPLYWLATLLKIMVAIVLPQVVHHNGFDAVHALRSLFFIPTFNAAGTVTPILGVGWSLVHEMYFYLVFSLAMLLGRRSVAWPAAFITAVCIYGQLVPPTSASMIMATNVVNGYFVIGMVMAVAATQAKWKIPASLLMSLALMAAGAYKLMDDDFLMPFIVKPYALMLGGLILLLYAAPIPKMLSWAAKLGDSSYALYLFHTFYATPMLLALHQLAPTTNVWLKIWASTLVSIGVGHFLHLMIEKPLNKRVAKLLGR